MRIRRHRKTRRKLKKQRKIIIVSLVCFMFLMVGGYSAFQTNLNITAKGNIKEKSRVIQSWTNTSNEDFHSDYYKENIVSATFLDNANVPSNAVDSWNVSEDKTHGGVMAWVVPNNEDNTKYDLYIGAKDGVVANEDSSYFFSYFVGLMEINFNNNFDTSNVIDMQRMFSTCSNLTKLDLTSFNTKNVTNMDSMFVNYKIDSSGNSTNLTTIIFGENFKTDNVTRMHAMFGNLYKLTDVDVSNFNTEKVTTMYDMFASCYSLKSIDVSNFDTRNVLTMQAMFFYCKSLESLNLCSFDTSNASDMNRMFINTYNLQNIYVGDSWTTENAETIDMFKNSKVSSVTTGQCS